MWFRSTFKLFNDRHVQYDRDHLCDALLIFVHRVDERRCASKIARMGHMDHVHGLDKEKKLCWDKKYIYPSKEYAVLWPWGQGYAHKSADICRPKKGGNNCVLFHSVFLVSCKPIINTWIDERIDVSYRSDEENEQWVSTQSGGLHSFMNIHSLKPQWGDGPCCPSWQMRAWQIKTIIITIKDAILASCEPMVGEVSGQLSQCCVGCVLHSRMVTQWGE